MVLFPGFSDVAAEALADVFHRATVSVFPSSTGAKGTKSADFTVTYATPSARLTGIAAHIEPSTSSKGVTVEGAADRVEHAYIVKIAPGVGDEISPGDRVRVVSCDDAALEGQDLHVLRVEARSGGFSRRVWCRRARQVPRATT